MRDRGRGAPVEEYLDQLLLTLSGPPREVRRTFAEVEAHLHDLVDEGVAAGLSAAQAQSAAVRRIGPPHVVSGRTEFFARPAAAIARCAVLAGSLVAGVGLIAVGIAGAVSWALAGIRGGSFVTAPFPADSYTHADCTQWMAGDRRAHSCVAAMIADHVGDIVLQGFAAGVLGVAALVTFWWLRRRWTDRRTLTALPPGSVEAGGAILAGLAVLITLGSAINAEIVQHGIGAGQPFSLAAAGAAAATFFAIRFRRIARNHGI